MSIMNANHDTLKVILTKYKGKVKINISNQDGVTPLLLLCTRKKGPLTEGQTMFLSLKDLDVNAQDDIHNNSPLHIAIKYQNLEIIKLLLDNPKIDINIKNRENETPIWYALSFNIYDQNTFDDGFEIVKLLLNTKKKIDIMQKTKEVYF